MNKKFTFKSLLLLCALIVGNSNLWAENVEVSGSYTFTTTGCSGWTTDHATSYCGGYGYKSGDFYVANTGIDNFSSVNFSLVTNPSVTISVTAVTNSGTNEYTVSLVDENGTVVGTPVTKTGGMGTGTNASSAQSSTVTLTPVAGTKGYRIDFKAKAAITATNYTLTYTIGASTPIVNITTTPINVTSAGGSGNLDITLANLTITSANDNLDVIFYGEDGTTVLTGDNKPTWVGQSITGNNTDGYKLYYNIGTNTTTGATLRVARLRVYCLDDNGVEAYSELLTITQTAKHTVTFTLDGGTFSANSDFSSVSVEKESGTYHLPSATKEGSVFDGWNDGTTTYTSNAEYTVSTDVTFTAQWRELQTYTLVTSVNDIVPGKHYIIANGTSGTVYAMGGQNTNNRAAVKISFSGSKILETTGVCEFVICGDTTSTSTPKYTIYDESTSKFLYTATTGNARLHSRDKNLNRNSQWSITFSNNNAAVITCAGQNVYNIMRYNPNTGSTTGSLFACYSSGQQEIFLYVKDGDTDGTIYSATTLSQSESYTNLTIVKTVVNNNTIVNGSVTVPNEKTLTVTGNLVNNGTAANLIIEEGGQLDHSNTGVYATMKKGIAAHGTTVADGGFYFISTPMASLSISNTEHTNILPNSDLYIFDQTRELEWQNYKKNNTENHTTFTTLEEGKGYLYANDNTFTALFMGELAYSSDGVVPVSYSTANTDENMHGWNLIGNPFACNAYLTQSYYGIDPEGGRNVVARTGAIAPCEGVMVQAASNQTSVTFSKTAPQSGSGASLQMTIGQQVMNRDGVSSTDIDNAIVSFNEGNELQKFYFGQSNANLYIPQGEKEYAIATSEGQGEMPLNFRANENGQYTLTVNPEGIEMNYLHLIDNMTGNDIDLLQTPSYSFNAKTTDYESRFRLVFSANNAIADAASEETFAFFSNGSLIVNNEVEATLQVVDVMGRVVSNQAISGTSELSLNQVPGVYVLRLISGDNVRTQKVIMK